MKAFTFGRGSHATREQGMCVNEAAAFLADEPHSDRPQCLCPVIAPLSIWLNDTADDQFRQEILADLPWRLVGTKATPEIERQRAYMAAEWAVSIAAPIMLRRAGFVEQAAKLEAVRITDQQSARAAADAAYAAYAAADAAADAAYAAYAADAAAYAAAYAADAAAYADDLRSLMVGCRGLIDRMVALTEPREVVPPRHAALTLE